MGAFIYLHRQESLCAAFKVVCHSCSESGILSARV